ncbi:MAG TPA: hypothetical protein VIM58_06740, partial [Candidatus Methylacidiphilales bacterium]
MSVSSLGNSPTPLTAYIDSIGSIAGASTNSLGSSEVVLALSTASFPRDTYQSSGASSSSPQGADAAPSPLQARAAREASDLLGALSPGGGAGSGGSSGSGGADPFTQKLQSLISELQKDLAAENGSTSSVGTTTSSVSSAAVDAFLGNLQAFGTQLLASAQNSAAMADGDGAGQNGQSGQGSQNGASAQSSGIDGLGGVQGGHRGGHGGHGHMGGAGRTSGADLLDPTDDTNSVTSSISLSLSSLTGALDLFTASVTGATSAMFGELVTAFGTAPGTRSDPSGASLATDSISGATSTGVGSEGDTFLQTLQTLGQNLATSIQRNLPEYQQQ